MQPQHPTQLPPPQFEQAGMATSHKPWLLLRGQQLLAPQRGGSSTWGRSCHPVPAGTAPAGSLCPSASPEALFVPLKPGRRSGRAPGAALAADSAVSRGLFGLFVKTEVDRASSVGKSTSEARTDLRFKKKIKNNALMENSGGLQARSGSGCATLSPGVRRGLRSQKLRAGGTVGLQKQPAGGRLWHRIDLTDGWAARRERQPPHPSTQQLHRSEAGQVCSTALSHNPPPRRATLARHRQRRHAGLHAPPCYGRAAHGAARVMPQSWLMLPARLL